MGTVQYLVACASPCGNCWYSWNADYQETRKRRLLRTSDAWDPEGRGAQIGLAPPRRPPSVQAACLATLGVTLFEPAEPGLPCLGLVRRTSQ